VPQEGEAQIGVGPDALEPVVCVDGGLVDGVRAQVGELARLQVGPDELHRVQLVPVSGELFDHEPAALLGDPWFHHFRTVGR